MITTYEKQLLAELEDEVLFARIVIAADEARSKGFLVDFASRRVRWPDRTWHFASLANFLTILKAE